MPLLERRVSLRLRLVAVSPEVGVSAGRRALSSCLGTGGRSPTHLSHLTEDIFAEQSQARAQRQHQNVPQPATSKLQGSRP